jgi:MoaA/NifB/PqqE/SkfB family radical SAM enzyme
LEQLEPFIPHLVEAKFLGGEPFLIKTYYQIWDLIIRLNPDIHVSITTNGTILNKRVEEILKKLKAHIIISIDSLDKENYESIRINANFDRVMENLQYYLDYTERRKTTITFAVCPMQQNWREMPFFLELCNERNIRLFFNTVTYPDNASLKSMRHDELTEITDYLKSVKFTEYTKLHKYNNSNYRDLIQQVSYYRNHSLVGDDLIV